MILRCIFRHIKGSAQAILYVYESDHIILLQKTIQTAHHIKDHSLKIIITTKDC